MKRLQLRQGWLNLDTPQVMGVLNVTPDSFSDGGRHSAPAQAVERARAMIDEGAAIIDIGGESTRPGAAAVDEDEELSRVLPVIERLAAETDALISIDTRKPGVMRAACAAGAQLINDINALRTPGALEAAAASGAAICLMHMQGEPQTMQHEPRYDDVVDEVTAFLRERIDAAQAAGIAASRLLVDPGFGFGKTLDHNLALLAALPQMASLGPPLLVGLSRKSMFGTLLGREVGERLPAGIAAAVLAVERGAALIRTHDVRATMDALKLTAAVRAAQNKT